MGREFVKGLASIIVPVYNVEPYLRECLDSIINQTYQNLEIILVNHRSTDGSDLICSSYAEVDSRINLIHLWEGDMVSYPRNKGLWMAKGEFCFFVDSDDYLELNAVEACVEKFRQYPEVNTVGYQAQFWCNNEENTLWHRDFLWAPVSTGGGVLRGPDECLKAFIRGDLLPAPWQRAYRTSFIKPLSFIESKDVVEDGAFLFELCCKEGVQILLLRKCLYNYRVLRPGSMTQKKTYQLRGSLNGFTFLLSQHKYQQLPPSMKGLSAILLLKYVMDYVKFNPLWLSDRRVWSEEDRERNDILMSYIGEIRGLKTYLPLTADGLIAGLLIHTNETFFVRTLPWLEKVLRRLRVKSLLYPSF